MPNRPISVVLATRHSAKELELTLASYAQAGTGFELVVVDDAAEDEIRLLCRRHTGQLEIKYLATPCVGRAAARNRGVRAADGDLILLADDGGLVSAETLASLGGTPVDDVAFLERRGLLTFFGPYLTGATTRRLANVLAHRPDLGTLVQTAPKTGELLQLVTAEDVRKDLGAVLKAFAAEDLLWERLAPAVAKFGPGLKGFSMPWIFGVSGYLCVDRIALLEVGLLDEAATDWDFDEPGLAYKLHQEGLRLRLADASVFHQFRYTRSWPSAGVAAIQRFADVDPVDAWLFARFLAHDPIVELDRIAGSRDGSAPTAENALKSVCKELMPAITHDLTIMWSRL